MNILFVIPNLEIGGAQSFLFRLASAMAETNNVFLFNIHPKQVNAGFSGQLLSDKVKVLQNKAENIELNIERKFPNQIATYIKRTIFKVANSRKINHYQLEKILEEHKIDIINSHMYLADLYIYHLIDGINTKVKWVSSFHGCYNLMLNNRESSSQLSLIVKQFKNILQKTDGVITAATKHNEVKEICELSEVTFKKIYYGFRPHKFKSKDLRREFNIPPDNIVFGMVARGDKTKGWKEAIKAFLSLPRGLKEKSYLILTGDGNYLKELGDELRQEHRIVFTGASDQPLREIKNFDVCLLPTYYAAESLPNSVIEYLYCGKPVIATDWAEIPYMLDTPGGKAGTIVPLENGEADVLQLNKAMQKYILSDTLLKEQSKLSLEAFKKFDMELCINNYIKFFNKAWE